MTHTYQVTGMTCTGCEAAVKSSLLKLPEITSVEVSRITNTAIITMDKHISLPELQKAIGGTEGKYQISALAQHEAVEETKNWFENYKPILFIFAYIIVVTSIVQLINPPFDFMSWMRHFMAGFFLVFSFFKLLNLSGFAESYAMYDVIAKQFKAWGFIYAFIELGLGLAYLSNFEPMLTNIVTFIVMSISLVGVLQSVLNKRRIRCACLGAVFNLPMSTVTIIEDALMILMSGIMIYTML
ncbi:MAG: cation transporter [Bacteroidota bacterium]|nr:cation transporter [Bacteroidota bacterium]